MSLRLTRYPAYKESHVRWLGRVPQHWELTPNRALFFEINERGHPNEQMLSVTIGQGVIPQRRLLSDSSKKDSSNLDKSAYKLVKSNDIAYNKMRAWQGAIGVSAYRGIISPAYVVMRPRSDEQFPGYFHYLFRTPAFAKEAERWSYGITSDQWSLRGEHFRLIYSPSPPFDEQEKIGAFLVQFDHQMNGLIRSKRRLIGLLEEQKQAVIHHAVTRGLHAGVDLKSSGIDCLGDLPQHWSTTTVRRAISLITSGSRGWAAFYSEAGDTFLQSGNLGRSLALDLTRLQRVMLPRNAEGARTLVRRDDVLLCITGALTGNVVIVDQDLHNAYINQHVALLRVRRDVVAPRFLAYVLHSSVGQLQFKNAEYGGTKQGLGLNEVKSVAIPLPLRHEQDDIVAHLDVELRAVQSAIASAQNQMALLGEYRTRLVADVVTGQLDVRGVSLPPLPDTDAEDPEADLDDADDSDLLEAAEALGEE